jgi:hypothetical protein
LLAHFGSFYSSSYFVFYIAKNQRIDF